VHSNGHRYYETGPDTVTALRRHQTRLLAESKRLARLAGTVSRTITELEQLEGDGAASAGPGSTSRPSGLPAACRQNS
jgi:hypothetical protein